MYVDSTIVYNDSTPELEETKLVSPSLTMEMGSAGSFTATFPKGNAGYSKITPITSTIEVYRESTLIWRGRPLTVSTDFWNNKTVTSEGTLAFLNDIILPLDKYTDQPLLTLLSTILTQYNNKVPEYRKIYPGIVSTVTEGGVAIGNLDLVTDNQSVMDVLYGIVDEWGLEIRIRYSNNKAYLDLLNTSTFTLSPQEINFGANLLDYASEYDWSDVVTAILPLGAELESTDATGDDNYPDRVTVKSVNNNNIYIENSSAINTYGRIEKIVEWSEIDDPTTLKRLAQYYLNDLQYSEMTLSVNVLDLHYLNVNTQAFDLYTKINCISAPHGLNKTFIISKMEIPLDDPENTKFTFTKTTSGHFGADKTSSVKSTTLSTNIAKMPTITDYRKMARENATNIINMGMNGVVTMVQSPDGSHTVAITITNNADPERATRKWTWNINGLMHQKRDTIDSPWQSANLAMTMDGEIVADLITTGRITAGSNYIDLDTGEVSLLSTTNVTIAGGTTTLAQMIQDILTADENAENALGDVSLLKVGAANGVDLEYGVSANATTKPVKKDINTDANKIWKKGKFLWVREKVTMYNKSVKYSEWRLLVNGDGIGVKKVTEQYYLSSSKKTPTNGSWSNNKLSYKSGYYYFTRTRIEWSDSTITYEPSVNGSLADTFTSVVDVYDTRLDQKKTFNKLTNNGKAKGLKTDSSGELYINADYISTGIISDLKGKNWWNLKNGDIQIMAVSQLEETISNQVIGGDNLIDGTAEWSNWVKRGNFYVYENEARSSARASITDSNQWTNSMLSPLGIKAYKEFKNKEITISFDIKALNNSWGVFSSQNQVGFTLRLTSSTKNERLRYRYFAIRQTPTTNWERVSYTVLVNDALFTGGTTPISDSMVLGIEIYNRSKNALYIRHVKVEIGNVASSWSASNHDSEIVAIVKANAALRDANIASTAKAGAARDDAIRNAEIAMQKYYNDATKYADNIATKFNKFTKEQVSALDASFNQQKIFEKLTKNGTLKGIKLDAQKNALYINADYINTGYLSANLIQSGLIMSKAARDYYKVYKKTRTSDSFWNLDNGYIQTNGMVAYDIKCLGNIKVESESSYRSMKLSDGILTGYVRDSTSSNFRVAGFVDASSGVQDVDTKNRYDAIGFFSKGFIHFTSRFIGVARSSNSGACLTQAYHGTLKFKCIEKIDDLGNGKIQWWTTEHAIKFVNGICVSAW